MSAFDIRRLDLTALMILSSLLRTRKATATAAEMGLTQSTISHALGRLRDVFDDALFVRRPHGLEPTSRALALEDKLQSLFELLRETVELPAFDARTSGGILRIAAADLHCSLLAGPLLQYLSREAPQLKLSFRPLTRRAALDALGSGEVDVAVGLFWNLPRTLEAVPLFDETYAVVAAREHPLIRGELDLKAYASARHVVVSLDGDLSGVVDRALAEQGLAREVVAAVPYFLGALSAVAGSDAVATLPARLAAAHAGKFGLAVFDPPLALRRFKVSAILSRAARAPGLAAWIARTVLPSIA